MLERSNLSTLPANLRDVYIDQLPVPLGQTYPYSLCVDCQGLSGILLGRTVDTPRERRGYAVQATDRNGLTKGAREGRSGYRSLNS